MTTKNYLIGVLAILAAPASWAEHSGDFIQQVNYDVDGNPYVHHIHVDGPDSNGTASGTAISPVAVMDGGALYQLYAQGSDSDTNFHLIDEQMVGAYTPVSTIIIETLDPYPVTRTRADQPFTVTVQAAGLLPDDPTAPAGAKKLLVESVGVAYDSVDNRVPIGAVEVEDVLGDFYVIGNGEVSRYGTTAMSSAIANKQRGEERFHAYALPDTNLGWLKIQSKEIQVWPVAEAGITGIVHGDSFQGDLPNVTVDFTDLYPSSHTYVHVYEGEQRVGASNPRRLESSEVHANTLVPQDAKVALTDWEDDLLRNGETVLPTGFYTLEVVTVTPFNNGEPEALTWVTFYVDRTIQINGNVTSGAQ
jgi:hypothetical protein